MYKVILIDPFHKQENYKKTRKLWCPSSKLPHHQSSYMFFQLGLGLRPIN